MGLDGRHKSFQILSVHIHGRFETYAAASKRWSSIKPNGTVQPLVSTRLSSKERPSSLGSGRAVLQGGGVLMNARDH